MIQKTSNHHGGRRPSSTISFELLPVDNSRLANLCGQFNEHLHQIGEYFKVDIDSRSNHFDIHGNGRYLKSVKTVIQTLYNVAGHENLSPATVQLYLNDNMAADIDEPFQRGEQRKQSIKKTPDTIAAETPGIHETEDKVVNDNAEPGTAAVAEAFDGGQYTRSPYEIDDDSRPYSSVKNRRGKITGRGKSQQQYLEQIKANDLTIGVGPAGTGKTYLAVASAVEALENDLVDRILLVRPAVEAGERLGFLPGDLAQKIDPYLRPMYDALFEMMGQQKVNRLLERNIIEIAPLAYMRGRTLNDAFIILDEAQNTTKDQMKMFLTRIGFGSKAVVTGDITQVDLPREKTSGLRHVLKILSGIKGVGITQFSKGDIVRHPLVKKIVHAYEQDELR